MGKRRRTRSASRRRNEIRHTDIRTSSQCCSWFAEEYNPAQIGSIDGTDTTFHDKGLMRASNAIFDAFKDPEIQGNPYATLFVARLSYSTPESMILDFFNKYGPVRRVRLVCDKKTNKSKGYAFVEFEYERDFERAYRHAHRRVIDGAMILVDYERSRIMKGWKPRRLGGGLGGKKESGQLRFGGRNPPFRPPSRPI
ncbi:u11 u12 small nuclear ribonucleoprotein 35 kda [Plasmopara halstedii]|uniref:U11 u12 small nuclear ribonucleoprotein 35 kDa n=1 Tax=Plasmopara halstedii TaxID=4781 RepID=A0A0P1AWF3_PLAHL|nr:u11 u12 small nuclear ribonucleoprotein 35 kda [Plasmopara halstedii]CEG45776.1 u11 u12 small nuclear ribonucleoprotein 35 kda [Plasmopara halstedii]|eukprot:XP_024582145.1 u11 u12 small nuclear ribonucleoprotein 35 kda [Plasmopara halstedii]